MAWNYAQQLVSRIFVCGNCGMRIASQIGFYSDSRNFIYICPHCDGPTHFDRNDRQYPDVAPGNEVGHLPPNVSELYREARNSVAAGAYTGSVLLCRKLLMNIGVSQGAGEGESFIYYVNYLSDKGFVPPNGKGWVDHIRKKGNEATHEIAIMKKEDCIELISFAEMLMKFIYEFPNNVPQPK
jgi:hypothetical protein